MEIFGRRHKASYWDELYPHPTLEPSVRLKQENELKNLENMEDSKKAAFWEPYQKLLESISNEGLTMHKIWELGGELREGVKFQDIRFAVSRAEFKSTVDKKTPLERNITIALQEVISFVKKEKSSS